MYRFTLAALILPLAACATMPPAAPVCPATDNWQVWIDAMPGPGAQLRLIVDGEVQIPPGFKASLRPGPLDRMQPPGQRFLLELTPGKGPSGAQRVRAEAKPAQTVYREVIVTCGGNAIARIDGSSIETAD